MNTDTLKNILHHHLAFLIKSVCPFRLSQTNTPTSASLPLRNVISYKSDIY